MPRNLYDNFSTSQPSDFEHHTIFLGAQPQFLQGFLLHPLEPLHTLGLGSLHNATDSLSSWLLPRSLNLKLHGYSVSRVHPSIGKLTIGHKHYGQGILPQENPVTGLCWKALQHCQAGCPAQATTGARGLWSEITGSRGCLKPHQV